MIKRWLIVLMAVSGVAWGEPLPTITEFTANMTTQSGYIPVVVDDEEDKLYLVIDKLDAPMIFQSSLPQGVGSNDIGLDRGQLGDTRLVQFSRHGKKVLLKQLNTRFRAVSDNKAESQSIDEAFADSVIAGFTVAAAEGKQVLIDYTPYLLSDIHGISERLKKTKQGENVWDLGDDKDGLPDVKSARMSHIYKRLDSTKPAYTVTGSGGGGTHVYHFKENRALTNRERARLQTFGDRYKFYGGKESVRRQIGMAVPVLAARKIMLVVKNALKKKNKFISFHHDGMIKAKGKEIYFSGKESENGQLKLNLE